MNPISSNELDETYPVVIIDKILRLSRQTHTWKPVHFFEQDKGSIMKLPVIDIATPNTVIGFFRNKELKKPVDSRQSETGLMMSSIFSLPAF